MNLFIDTSYKINNNIINKLLNINSLDNINLIQLNAAKFEEFEFMLENNELIDKIKLYFQTSNISKNNRTLINKLCLLYFQGGIIINSNILIKNNKLLEYLYLNNDISIIKSCINNDTIFDGIIACKKYNSVILKIIEQIISNSDISNIDNLLLNDNSITKLNEEIILDKSNIYYNNEILAEHFLNNTFILERLKVDKNILKCSNNNKKIGITIPIPNTLNEFYSNGIRQNCLYLYELLKNINYDVRLIIDDIKNISVLKNINFYKFEYILENEIFMYDFDLIITMGFSFPNQIYKCLKNMNVKNVYYMCGNKYLIDAEQILYNQHLNRDINFSNEKIFNEIWIIPQMYKQNKCYYEILTNVKCIQVPFIWSSMSIKLTLKILNLENENSLLYSKKNTKIAIFEPNMSVMKWSLPCILIAENTYKNYKNIDHLYITNLNKTSTNINNFNMTQFNNICRNLELFNDKKMSSEGRFNTLDFMRNFCDIAISHQWENPLNYLYFDLAWMGWPILHNAYLCKDVGYYYEDFNYIDASEKLNSIIINHNTNASEYMKKNREIINEYLPSNKCLQNKYKNLINNLFERV